MDAMPPARTIGELRDSGYRSRPLREELRDNLVDQLARGVELFPGIIGYEETVVPAIENALLAGHDMIFLGERGQAKSRMIRALVALLDPWVPEIDGGDTRDDPFAPVSPAAREIVAERGDRAPIRWVPRTDRYVEKLATPDVSVADLVGDVDPIAVAKGRSLADAMTMHFGLLPRANRGIFCINELPDLAEKVQVALFNLMQERDVQIKGYNLRLPLDVLVVASANPDDYTSRGRIITPLKDRYAAQIRTHYPKTRALELAVVRGEARPPRAAGVTLEMPDYMADIVAEITMQARASSDVSQAAGVSVRMSISNFETLAANAIRRALRLGEPVAVPRISDLPALGASTLGKLELEMTADDGAESDIVDNLVRRAVKVVFDERTGALDLDPVVQAFGEGWQVEVSADSPAEEYLGGVDQIPGLRAAVEPLAEGESPAHMAAAIELILEGLHLQNQLNKDAHDRATRFGGAPEG
jgi:magnesium chelatase subunit I